MLDRKTLGTKYATSPRSFQFIPNSESGIAIYPLSLYLSNSAAFLFSRHITDWSTLCIKKMVEEH